MRPTRLSFVALGVAVATYGTATLAGEWVGSGLALGIPGVVVFAVGEWPSRRRADAPTS